jgi:hypothetical protein
MTEYHKKWGGNSCKLTRNLVSCGAISENRNTFTTQQDISGDNMDAGLNLRPFQPFSSILITADAVTSGGVVVTFTDAQDIAAPHVMVCNEGSLPGYMGINANAAVPTSTPSKNSTPVPAAQTLMFYKGPGVATLKFSTATGTTPITVTAGIGS